LSLSTDLKSSSIADAEYLSEESLESIFLMMGACKKKLHVNKLFFMSK